MRLFLAAVPLFVYNFDQKNIFPGKKSPPPGGLEPPTFRLTAERASRLRHGGLDIMCLKCIKNNYYTKKDLLKIQNLNIY